jgi:hypothetical protein
MKMARSGVVSLVLLAAAACSEQPGQRGPAEDATMADAPAMAEAAVGDGAAPALDGKPVGADGAPASDGPPKAGSLSAKYPGDKGLDKDPAVLFHDDFEGGWGKWQSPTQDTTYLHLETDASLAHGGSKFLRSTVTKSHLDAQKYISSSTKYTFAKRVDEVYWRFHVRFKGVAPNPHHWVRLSAGDATYGSSGLANTVPPGDKGFWFDFDANNDDVFNFYVYWYKMRSGRCNDGSATPGCAGDQGTTYYYGNTFRPPGQTPFPRDKWFCVEIRARVNTVGSSDGELAFWIDDKLVDEYKPGHPVGTWLRDTFHTGGCTFSACTPPKPFEGFDFRSSAEVRFKRIFLDAYYQQDTFASKKAALENKGLTVSDEQTIYYDDVVVATQRIGCMVGP